MPYVYYRSEVIMRVFLERLAASIGVTIVLLAPTWLWLAARHFLNPTGFWQNFVLMGVGLYFFGILQFVLGIVLIFGLFQIWTS